MNLESVCVYDAFIILFFLIKFIMQKTKKTRKELFQNFSYIVKIDIFKSRSQFYIMLLHSLKIKINSKILLIYEVFI